MAMETAMAIMAIIAMVIATAAALSKESELSLADGIMSSTVVHCCLR